MSDRLQIKKIKRFRAWDPEKGKMMDPEWLLDNGYSICPFSGEVMYAGYIENFVVMQYLGVEDAEGNSIYEGDIVACSVDEIRDLAKPWFDATFVPYDGPTKVMGNIYQPSKIVMSEQSFGQNFYH